MDFVTSSFVRNYSFQVDESKDKKLFNVSSRMTAMITEDGIIADSFVHHLAIESHPNVSISASVSPLAALSRD